MKFKIISDSSSNLYNNYINKENIIFEIAPLSIFIGDEQFIDNDNIDTNLMLNKLKNLKLKTHTSCPSSYEFENRLNDCDYYFIVTISSKLSGSYNSALIASQDKDNVLVIDSKLAGGSLKLIVDKLEELIEQGLSFKEISEQILKYRDELNTYFILDNFDNLVRNGRMNKIIAFIATHAHIKPLCYGADGEIKIKAKVRTMNGCLVVLANEISKILNNNINKKIVINHTNNVDGAKYLKKILENKFNYNNIEITSNKGLCAFYSLEGGIIASF